MIIIHFALKNEWDEESSNGFYGENYISKNTFIPCFKPCDISSINLNFSTLKNYVILCIDEAKISSEIKYENFKMAFWF